MQSIKVEDFRFSMPLSIRWNDLDPLNHVNNVYYFEYFQIGRGYYMPAVSAQWDWTKHMFVIAHIECDYYKELKIPASKPAVRIRTTSIGDKSFEIEYIITTEKKDGDVVIHARGKSVQVMVDMTKGKSMAVPDWVKEALLAYEPSLV